MVWRDALVAGSSPLTRGKLLVALSACDASGLIPAHAGKTHRPCRRAPGGWAHPRSRGENGTRSDLAYVTEGSSPLTRGKRGWPRAPRHHARLIPAHAGKTWRRASSPSSWAAHPRSRGENEWDHISRVETYGSSPLTRGKPDNVVSQGNELRLIPAHAGKTRWRGPSTRSLPAHPRSRGENALIAASVRFAVGSSPLTRGKLCPVVTDDAQPGLIPAHAGKTLPDLRFYCADRSDLGNP